MKNQTTKWEYQSLKLEPGESWYEALRINGSAGREAWHMDANDQGWREIYFKRPVRE
jgi:hypothetical protein